MKALKILVTGANGFLGRSLLGLEGEAEWIGCGRRAELVGGFNWQIKQLVKFSL